MKTVGKRKPLVRESERHRAERVEDAPGYMLPKYGNVLLSESLATEIDTQAEDVARKAYRKQVRNDERERAKRTSEFEAKKNPPALEVTPVRAEELPHWCGSTPGKHPHLLYHELDLISLDRVINNRTGTSSREVADKARVKALVERWRQVGGQRAIAGAPERWANVLKKLAVEMPNFVEVIEYLKGEFALAEMSGQPPRLSPMLLDGPPGVGKTRFARALADMMGSGFTFISMETSQTSTQLSGSEEHWANSKTGLLFATLIENQFSNPVVLIDEVEKASTSTTHDPLASLYSLLEPTTAKHWYDLAMPALKLDASKVIWIMTSNDKARLPRALLSRMRVFDVPGLDKTQSVESAKQIFRSTVRRLHIDFEETLDERVLNALGNVTPRVMTRISREIIAKAVLSGRRSVIVEDLKGTISIEKKEAGTGAEMVPRRSVLTTSTLVTEWKKGVSLDKRTDDEVIADIEMELIAAGKLKLH